MSDKKDHLQLLDILRHTREEIAERNGYGAWTVALGLAISEISALSVENENLQQYKDFTRACATVSNHEGWQGKYFREAQRLFFGADSDQQS